MSFRRWIPSIGKRLILQRREKAPQLLQTNYPLPPMCSHCYELSNTDFHPALNIYTEFGDLTPNQILSLYTTFRRQPEFDECLFVANMETTLMRQPTNEESINDIEPSSSSGLDEGDADIKESRETPPI